MGQLNKTQDERSFQMCGLMMVRFYSRKMVAIVQNYSMVKWGKRHVELWKRTTILCVLCIFT